MSRMVSTIEAFKQLKRELDSGQEIGEVYIDFMPFREGGDQSEQSDEALRAYNAPHIDTYLTIVCQAIESAHCDVVSLGISYCTLSDTHLDKLLVSLEKAEGVVEPKNHLKKISLNNIPGVNNKDYLTQMLRLPALSSVIFNRTLTTEGAQKFAQGLRTSPYLKSLSLNDTQNLGDGITQIFSALPICAVQELYMSNCKVNAEQLAVLVHSVQQGTKLRVLSLDRNEQIKAAVPELLATIATGAWLPEKLSLFDCGFDSSDLRTMQENAFAEGALVPKKTSNMTSTEARSHVNMATQTEVFNRKRRCTI